MWAARLHEPAAPPPIKLSPAGSLVPPQYGQEDNSADRYDQDVSQRDTFHGRAPRASVSLNI
jgi:hypothetical protein